MLKDRYIEKMLSRTIKLINGEYAKIEIKEGGTLLNESDREQEQEDLYNMVEKELAKSSQKFKRYIKNEHAS